MLRAVFVAFALAAISVDAGGTPQSEGYRYTLEQLQVGEYYKPSAIEGSGVPNTTAPFHRCPCPALNALANHGYLPRNGQNIGKGVLKAAIMNVFNMADDIATTQVSQVPEVFSLDFLSKHNAPEHDASLVHTDAYFGRDPMEVNVTLADDLLVRAVDGKIDTTAVARVRKGRAVLCESSNPECTFGENEKKKSFLQAALLLKALGEGDVISVKHAKAFLVEEKIPSDFVKSPEPVSAAALSKKSAELGCMDTSEQLPVGEYYKPTALESSGVPNTTATFRRSPCPGLNALANHGYLPRNGQNIVKADLKAAIMSVFNMGDDTATTQVNPVPEVFSLDYLGQHILPEHDASLLRSDIFFGHDPMEVNITLAEDLLSRADADGKINTTAVAQAHNDRVSACKVINPECTFGANEKQTALLQAVLLLEALGAGDFISVDHARSFLIDEKIPSDFVKSADPVSVAVMTAKYVELVSQAP
ncbi:putative sterigmatocystin biosynthesis peroxidase stcC [Phytophthora citrophthora]|uniref:Sterigmatocystin biosynthesis peroxidase stcC n=1 Tax=Phytophthora citrophthora TaxID=4793 RepID=A0AAD9LQ36_9STRA|nr:putative sterigmatocystin biosynthesis peroxidase stcC [Phytophthora citrophthora]